MNSGEPRYSRRAGMRQQVLTDKELQKVSWQSDYPIVSKKSMKVDGEKGIARKRWDTRDTSAGHRAGVRMSTKLVSLTQQARGNPKYVFMTLMHLFTEEYLLECFAELKRNRSAGIDGVTVEEYEVNLGENIKDLITRMRAWKYMAKPARRVYIPKAKGKERGLGIPSVEDKIVQMGMKKILEAIFEVDFVDVSYGFRPNKSCHDALEVVDKTIMTKPVNHVVDMDIEKFFGNIDHGWMMRCLQQRIGDRNFLRLVGKFLRAGVMEGDKVIETDKGTPQGGVLSPILANIYLHFILDLWFEKVVKKGLKGYTQLTRYADDFIVCFQQENEAKVFGEMLRQRLGKVGLSIAEDKARLIEFGRYAWQKAEQEGRRTATFDFLGFTHYCDKTRKGKFKVGRKTAQARLRQKMKAMNQWLKGVRNLVELKEWWKTLQRKLVGHYNYYGISGNYQGVRKFYKNAFWQAYKWINRRSQKKSYNFERFCRFLKYNPLPKPRIYHLTYTLSSC